MVWRRIFHRDSEPDDTHDNTPRTAGDHQGHGSHSAQPSANPPAGETQSDHAVPPHMQEALTQQPERRPRNDDPRSRLAKLQRRRTAVLYDVEQGEMAHDDDNPWKQRAALLTEALETVEGDRAETVHAGKEPYYPVAPIPIRNPEVTFQDEAATVAFDIGDQHFSWEEPLDWAERGRQVIRGDLVQTTGSIDPLLPDDVPPGLRDPLRSHLELSLFVHATDLRERTLEDDPQPSELTLAELARPCPECGGWTDVLGRCQACARRNARIQQLAQERNRLLSERSEELEEEHRMAERLSIARRRLADIDREITSLEQSIGDDTS